MPVDSRELIPTYRTAALCSEVWQKRKRTSRRDFVKAYFAADMAGVVVVFGVEMLLSEAAEEERTRARLLGNCGLVVGKDGGMRLFGRNKVTSGNGCTKWTVCINGIVHTLSSGAAATPR